MIYSDGAVFCNIMLSESIRISVIDKSSSNLNQNEKEESVNDVELQILLEDYIKVHNNLAAVLKQKLTMQF